MPSSKAPRDRVIYKTISALVLLFTFCFPTASHAATFGKTDIGASTRSPLSNFTYGVKANPGETGDVSSISFYMTKDTAGSATRQGALYQASDMDNLGTTNTVSVTNALDWYTATLASTISVSSQDYYIATWLSSDFSIRYDVGAAGIARFENAVGFEDPWSGYSDSTSHYSIYATYTAAAEEETPVTPYTTIKGDVQMKGDVYFSP